MGGPTWPPQPPSVRHLPAKPGRASVPGATRLVSRAGSSVSDHAPPEATGGRGYGGREPEAPRPGAGPGRADGAPPQPRERGGPGGPPAPPPPRPSPPADAAA